MKKDVAIETAKSVNGWICWGRQIWKKEKAMTSLIFHNSSLSASSVYFTVPLAGVGGLALAPCIHQSLSRYRVNGVMAFSH